MLISACVNPKERIEAGQAELDLGLELARIIEPTRDALVRINWRGAHGPEPGQVARVAISI